MAVLTSPLGLRPLIGRPLTRVNSYGLANHRSPQRPLGHSLADMTPCVLTDLNRAAATTGPAEAGCRFVS